MRRVRAITRLVFFLGFTVLVYVLRLLVRMLLFWSPRADFAVRTHIFHLWGHLMRRVIGMRVEMRGTPPTPPFMLVSNHLGYVDVALLAMYIDGLFVAKSDVSGWPILGPIIRAFDTIFIERENKKDILVANRAIEQAVRAGRGVLLFAEGTSSGGEGVLPLKPSLLEVAARDALPVSYATITYDTPPGEPSARTSVCWWGGAPFMPHLMGMLGMPWFRATLIFGEGTIQERDRKVLARKLHELIQKQHIPVAA